MPEMEHDFWPTDYFKSLFMDVYNISQTMILPLIEMLKTTGDRN
jgi:hypothetical protein